MGEIGDRLAFRMGRVERQVRLSYGADPQKAMAQAIDEAFNEVARAIGELEDKIDRQNNSAE